MAKMTCSFCGCTFEEDNVEEHHYGYRECAEYLKSQLAAKGEEIKNIHAMLTRVSPCNPGDSIKTTVENVINYVDRQNAEIAALKIALRDETEKHKRDLASHCAQFDRLTAENAALQTNLEITSKNLDVSCEALEWYSDASNYKSFYEHNASVMIEKGERAIAALEKIRS